METTLVISISISIISIIIWICVMSAFGLRTRKSEFAMMGGKIEFKGSELPEKDDNWESVKRIYITTDNKRFNVFDYAYDYQKNISLKNHNEHLNNDRLESK